MDVGTAKPDAKARAEVRYDGLDLVPPGARFSAGLFRRAALDALARNRNDGVSTIAVGGTGLYVKSLTHGLAAGEPVSGDAAEIQETARAAVRDPRNPRRVLRAMQRAEAGEKPSTQWTGRSLEGGPLVGLWVDPEELRRRIAARVDALFAHGLLDEVRSLLAAGSLSATSSQAIGYAEAIACLAGDCTPSEARERMVRRTCQLAKRQRTWFRHQSPAEWVDVTTLTAEQAAERVGEIWGRYGPTGIACD